MSNNRENSNVNITVPSRIHKIQNITGGECWVTLASPDLALDTPQGELPLFDLGQGDIAVTSGNTVYACTGQSVYKAGASEASWSTEDPDANFTSMCQIDDILFMGSANGVYWYNPATNTGGNLFNTGPVTSVGSAAGVLYYIENQSLIPFTFTSMETLNGVQGESFAAFELEATVLLAGTPETLFAIISENGVSIQRFDLNTQTVASVQTPTGASFSSVSAATAIYAFHNNQDRSNHFLYLLSGNGQLIAAYPETQDCQSCLVPSAYSQVALAASPYDNTGEGQNTYLFGLAQNGSNGLADQINPTVNTPICMATQAGGDALTTVLPNNTYALQAGDNAQTTMTFQPAGGAVEEPITVYHGESAYTVGETTYSFRCHQIIPTGDYGIDYVAYEEEPGSGYEALMATIKVDGGVVIIGEMDLDPVMGDSANPRLH